MEVTFKAEFIDLFFLILCLRVIYIAVSRGLVSENFRIAGIFVSSFFAFQYFASLGDNLQTKVLFLNAEYLYLASFILIFFATNIIFSLARLIAVFLYRKKESTIGENWLLLFIGAFRAAFLSSVIIFALRLSPLDSKYFHNSISSNMFSSIAPNIYFVSFGAYNNLINSEAVQNPKVKEYTNYKNLDKKTKK